MLFGTGTDEASFQVFDGQHVADIIMFIYRDEYYTKEACKEPGVAEVIISKQRNGPTGTVKLAFINRITKFESLAHSSGDF